MLKRHSQILVSHIDTLVSNTNIDNLIPEIVSNNVFTQDMVNRILDGAGTDVNEQTRALYLQVPKRGPQAFTGLVSALLKSGHESLGQMLLEIDGTDSNPFPPYPRDSPDFSAAHHSCWYSHTVPYALPQYMETELRDILPLDGANSEDFHIDLQSRKPWAPVTVIHAEREHAPTDGALEYYQMMSRPRGYALIVNNIDFDGYPVRNGAANDELALKDLFGKLYFDVESHTNKTKHEMVEIVERFAAKDEWSAVDCCWVVIMSHGQEGASEEDTEIIGTDGLGLKTREILSYFYNNHCPRLRNKPKIFIFQSCRGLLTDPGVRINRHGAVNGYSYHHRTETDGRNQRSDVILDRSRSDMFIAYPVPPGMKANRDIYTGAWFIQNIVWGFANYCFKYELEDLFKIVDRRIRRMINPKDPNHQTVSTRTIGWNKKLFFNPGLYFQNMQLVREINEIEGVDVVDNDRQNGKNGVKANGYRAKNDSDSESNTTCCSCFR